MRFLLSTVLFASLLVGCASVSWTTVPYAPQPDRSQDPRAEVLALLKASEMAACHYQTTFEGTLLKSHVKCDNVKGDGSDAMLKTDKLAGYKLESAFGNYRVMFEHNDGSPHYIYGSQAQGDVERFINAVAKLAPGLRQL